MDINKIVEVIKNGGLAVIPTDTVYGIVGDATNIDVIHKVYDVKNRDYSKPLIIMVSSIEMLKKYIKDTNDLENELINKYWPGRLTLLLRKNDILSNVLTNNSEYIGVRWADNKDINEIINKLGVPIISTSANISKKDTITNVSMLENSIKDRVDYIYDGGEVLNLSSTIVKVNSDKIEILRSGDLVRQIEKDFKINF